MMGLLAKQLSHRVLHGAAEDMYDEYSWKKREGDTNKPQLEAELCVHVRVCVPAHVYWLWAMSTPDHTTYKRTNIIADVCTHMNTNKSPLVKLRQILFCSLYIFFFQLSHMFAQILNNYFLLCTASKEHIFTALYCSNPFQIWYLHILGP